MRETCAVGMAPSLATTSPRAIQSLRLSSRVTVLPSVRAINRWAVLLPTSAEAKIRAIEFKYGIM